MKKFFGVLPLLGILMAAGVVLAEHLPNNDVAVTRKAFINGTWQPIPGQVLNEDYVCDQAPAIDCTADFDEQNQMVPGTLIKGEYREL